MDTAVPAPATPQPATGRLVAASIVGLIALLLVSAGIAALWARFGSSEHGWVSSGTHRYAASGRAIESGSLDADGIPTWLVGKLRVTAASDDNRPIFVGVGRRADVDRYLAGVAHATLQNVDFDPFEAEYTTAPGTVVPARPTAQTFWASSKVGTGKQTVSWTPRDGKWRVVVMNADGSPRVVADAKVGTSFRNAVAIPVTATLLALGLLLAGVATALGVSASRRS